MQYSKTLNLLTHTLLATCLAGAAAYAGDGYEIVDDYESGNYGAEYGGWFANATLDLYAYRSVEAAYSYSKGPLFYASLYGRARLDGEVLDVDFPIAQARGKAYLRTGSWSGSGSSIYNTSKTWSPDDYGKFYLFGTNLSWFNKYDGFGDELSMGWYWTKTIASATFWVGPVPVTVGADAGAYAGFNVQSKGLTSSSFNPSYPNVGLDAGLYTFGVGILFGGVGVSWASAGVEAELQLGSTAFNVDIYGTKSGGHGNLKLDFNAVKMLVKLYAKVDYWIGSSKWTKTLLSKSYGHFTKSIGMY